MQIDAFGPSDARCQITRNKIEMIEDEEDNGKVEAALQSIPNLESRVGKKSVSLLRVLKSSRRKIGRKSKHAS